jgi:hypothetical protein
MAVVYTCGYVLVPWHLVVVEWQQYRPKNNGPKGDYQNPDS